MNTLTSPLIRVIGDDGQPALLTLPGVLATLMRDAIAGFPVLRPHQRHAWHSFLVLLAANALHRAGRTEPPEDEDSWRDLLRGLTSIFADDAPWCLVSPPDRPALLQASVSDGNLAALRNEITTPDGLDVLITSRNHDLKRAVMKAVQPDDWLFALVTLQTMEGYSGAKHYGVSRMEHGNANRTALSIAAPGGPGARVKRDLIRLLATRRQSSVYAAQNGLALVWLAPWDGSTSLRADALDEWYIEICRRVRLQVRDGRLMACAGVSEKRRILQIPGGVTGDPWSPVETKQDGGVKSLTVDARGFSYRRMVDFMFRGAGVSPAPLQELAATDAPEDLTLIARALARDQGKTEGYHERRVPLSRKARFGLGEEATDPVADAARDRVRLAGEMQNRVLKRALFTLFQNGPEKIDFGDKNAERKAEIFLKRFDILVDQTFFDDLWRERDHDAQAARDAERGQWVRTLLKHAETLLHAAEASAPRASRRRFRAQVLAADQLRAAARRNRHLSPHLQEAATHDAA